MPGARLTLEERETISRGPVTDRNPGHRRRHWLGDPANPKPAAERRSWVDDEEREMRRGTAVDSATSAAGYNYARFDADYYSLDEFPGPRAGEPMPDLTLWTLDGERVRLHDFLTSTLVLDAGSLSCPMYVNNLPDMRELAQRHPEVRWLALYVREAHPGSDLEPHHSLDDKISNARRTLRDEDEFRTILVDDLEGTAHRTLGALPNILYVVDEEGTVRFRADWARPGELETVLSGERGEVHERWHFEPRKPNPRLAFRVLRRSGWNALFDLLKDLPRLFWMHKVANWRYRRAS